MKKIIFIIFIIFIINDLFSIKYNIKQIIFNTKFKENKYDPSIINIEKNFSIEKNYSIEKKNISTQAINNDYKKKYAIIFIHGTYGVDIITLMQILYYKIFNKKKLKALFKEIEQKRFNKKLDHHEAICSNQRGLEKINFQTSTLHPSYQYIENNLKQEFSNYLKTNNIDYHAFNWSGSLSDALRKKESLSLYQELITIKENNPDIEFIIISFSHGGNIALELQNIEKKYKKKLFIKLLILIGTPIGKTSEINAQGDIFQRIINIFSIKDMYQISDLTFNFPYNPKRVLSNKNKKITNVDIRFTLHKNKKKIIIFPHHKYLGSVFPSNSLPIFYTLIPYILEQIKIFYNKNKKNNNLIINIPI